MASLKKFQIISELDSKYGISISSVQKLNKLLAEMGILVRIGSSWRATQKGLPYSIFSSTQVVNPDLWRESIVDAIAKYLKNK